MNHECPHCGKPINPAKMLGSVTSPKKIEAGKKRGELLQRMWANARKVQAELDSPPREDPEKTYTVVSPGGRFPRPTEKMEPPIPPKPTTLEGKKAAALRALAGAKRGQEMGLDEYNEIATRPLHETPRAPFDVNLEGEPHRVTTMGKKLGLFYMGNGEPNFRRFLEPGEMEKFWEQRIK